MPARGTRRGPHGVSGQPVPARWFAWTPVVPFFATLVSSVQVRFHRSQRRTQRIPLRRGIGHRLPFVLPGGMVSQACGLGGCGRARMAECAGEVGGLQRCNTMAAAPFSGSTNDPLLRLRQHAGLPQLGADIPRDTLAEFVFQIPNGTDRLDLGVLTEDIIHCLDMLNRQINQRIADEGHQQQEVPPALVYAASGMVLMCMEKAIELRQREPQSTLAHDLLVAAWRIQCAWDGLIAGDFDDLCQHVTEEERARFGLPVQKLGPENRE